MLWCIYKLSALLMSHLASLATHGTITALACAVLLADPPEDITESVVECPSTLIGVCARVERGRCDRPRICSSIACRCADRWVCSRGRQDWVACSRLCVRLPYGQGGGRAADDLHTAGLDRACAIKEGPFSPNGQRAWRPRCRHFPADRTGCDGRIFWPFWLVFDAAEGFPSHPGLEGDVSSQIVLTGSPALALRYLCGFDYEV